MAKVLPINFKRSVAAAFKEVSRQRQGPFEDSSGSEYSMEMDRERDLSNLVNSFIERGDHWVGSTINSRQPLDDDDRENYGGVTTRKAAGNYEEEEEQDRSGSLGEEEERNALMRLLGGEEEEDGPVVVGERLLKGEVEVAWRRIVGDSDTGCDGGGFKRSLMVYLRDRGYDAGLCKSRWEKSNRYPAGEYEYIDVIISSSTSRYIVETNLSHQFQVARPTPHYVALLNTLPRILIAKPETLKKVIRLMSNALKKSLKSANMPVPPWRRSGYITARWFGKYRRTTNAVPSNIKDHGNGHGEEGISSMSVRTTTTSRDVGFKAPDFVFGLGHHNCRHNFAPAGFRAGLLAAAFPEM